MNEDQQALELQAATNVLAMFREPPAARIVKGESFIRSNIVDVQLVDGRWMAISGGLLREEIDRLAPPPPTRTVEEMNAEIEALLSTPRNPKENR